MPPAALVLAILLHILIGVAIWWLAPLQPSDPEDQPIMVMFDTSPSNVGLQTPEKAGPPAESTAANPPPATEPQSEEHQQQALAPPQPATVPEQPRSSRPSEAQPQPEQVPSLPIFEFSVPPPVEPTPPPSSRDFQKPSAPPPPPRPVQRTQPPRLAPTAPQRPPTQAPATMPSPVPGPEPGDVLIGQGRQRNDYLTRVFRHLEPYRISARASHGNQSGRVVTRVTIGRDGGLIDVRIDSSSGRPALDAAELEAIRKAAPFPPVPGGMPGDPIILILRMTY